MNYIKQIGLKYIFALILIMLLGFFLRSIIFLHGNFYLLSDQGRDLLLAREIVINHKITLIGGRTGFGGLFHGPLWWYMVSVFFFISKGNPFFSLVPLWIIISILIIPSSFLLGNVIDSKKLGILLAFLVGVSVVFVSSIATASNSQVMPLIFIFYLISLMKYLNGNKKFLYLLSFTIGIGMHFESAFAFFLIPSSIFTLIIWKKIPNLKSILISILIFLFCVSNFILFDLRHQFLMLNSMINLFFKKGSSHIGIFQIIIDRIHWFYYSIITIPFSTDKLVEFLSVMLFALFIFLFIKRRKEKRSLENLERVFLILLSFFGIIFLSYLIVPIKLASHYIYSLGILNLLIFTIALFYVFKNVKYGSYLVSVYIVLALLFSFYNLNTQFRNKAYNLSGNGTYFNELGVADSIYKDSKGSDFAYLVYDPPIVT